MRVTGGGCEELDACIDRVTEHPYVAIAPRLGSDPVKELVQVIHCAINLIFGLT